MGRKDSFIEGFEKQAKKVPFTTRMKVKAGRLALVGGAGLGATAYVMKKTQDRHDRTMLPRNPRIYG